MKSRFQLVILFITVFILSACRGSDGAFGPIFPTPTQIGIVNQEPVPVDFETLNSDPFIFVDRFVRVTGRYVPKRDAVCAGRQRGPSIDWFLISDGLQMEMSGFGSVVELAPEQAFFTLDGIWRQYTGPVGCTKEPVEKTVWYLEVVRIIDPNPLVASANSANRVTVIAPSNNTAVDPQPESTTAAQEELQPADSPLETATLPPSTTPITSNGNPTVNPTATPFVVASPVPSTPTPVATSASGTRATVIPTPSPAVSAVPSMTVTATPTTTDEDEENNDDGLGGTGGGTPNPATPVPNPGNYPSPQPPPESPNPTDYPSPTP